MLKRIWDLVRNDVNLNQYTYMKLDEDAPHEYEWGVFRIRPFNWTYWYRTKRFTSNFTHYRFNRYYTAAGARKKAKEHLKTLGFDPRSRELKHRGVL